MVKDHVIKYHKKTSSRPAMAPGSTLNDFIGHCSRRIIAPLRATHATTPILPGYDPLSEIALRANNTITVSTKGAKTCLLIRQLLIRELRHAGIM
ncbi:hypothetical protein AVEN_18179-1 [Araneus ventricosus]|uniref:Uncharacterized protein n=1 Tax=Araneus ventricosus TaxID=182803 RepID=A0A4Y2AKX7_ARAVE|nr:hypothetical protein AVEN_18179-1 [Araneus ventricosus]